MSQNIKVIAHCPIHILILKRNVSHSFFINFQLEEGEIDVRLTSFKGCVVKQIKENEMRQRRKEQLWNKLFWHFVFPSIWDTVVRHFVNNLNFSHLHVWTSSKNHNIHKFKIITVTFLNCYNLRSSTIVIYSSLLSYLHMGCTVVNLFMKFIKK